jgi:hypothetical protein
VGLGLGARVIDVLDREIQLVPVPFRIAAELAAAVSQHAQELDVVLLERRQDTVIEQIGAGPGGIEEFSFAPVGSRGCGSRVLNSNNFWILPGRNWGSCVDGARGSRIFWLSACGRVQVMCPACLRGAHDRWP